MHLRMANACLFGKRAQETPAFVIADNGNRFHWHAGIKMLDVECEIASRAAAMALFRDKLRNGRLPPASASPSGCCQRTMCRR